MGLPASLSSSSKDAAESIAAKWVRSLINPNSVQQALRDELLRTVPMLRRLPRHVDRAFSNLERDGLRVRVTHFSDAIGLVSVGLIAIDGGPAFSDRTTLFRVLGYFGLFCATVLAMRVIVAVLRDGLN